MIFRPPETGPKVLENELKNAKNKISSIFAINSSLAETNHRLERRYKIMGTS